ncbi:hypothetical protein jhhlp_004355 [Lomentospora prolificans]|uniref:Mid2 domain-containing protein n=1 Tax=Lomentospora prolificans TaxID=41688 RepID=A0A2N3NBC3_9PEZI|nr:hypothetical protein jhhlp_004355 [Lomentospora prolificans]
MLTLRAAALAAALTSASAHNIPYPHQARETGAFVFPFDQITPWPTQAPEPPAQLVAARADSTTTTVYVGPDNICGYIDGRPGASLYCPAGANCVLFTAQPTMSGAVACCNADACNLRLTCMDYNQVVSSSLCDNGCMVDAFTLKCTNSLRPYCNTASFSSNIFDYWCNDVSISSTQTVLTAYEGQTSRDFSPLALDSTTSLEIPSSTVINGPDPTDDTTDDDDDEETPTPTPTEAPKKKTNAGAIAGGVVGGIAGLGLIGLGAFFLFRKRKNDKTAAAAGGAAGAAAAVPPATGPYPPNNQQPQMAYAQQPGQHPQSVYNPAYAQPGQQFTTTPPAQGWDPSNNGSYYAPSTQQGGLTPVSPDRMNSTSPQDARASTVGSPTLSSTSGFGPYQQGAQQPYAPGQPQIHEAGGPVDHHRGHMHELA